MGMVGTHSPPTVELSSACSPSDGRVQLRGSGFDPGRVSVLVDDRRRARVRVGERGSFRVKFGVEPDAAILETREKGSGRRVTNHLQAPGACRFGLAEVSDSRGASASYSTPLEAGGELEIAASGLRPDAPATLRLRGQAGEHRRTTAAGGLEASLPIDRSRGNGDLKGSLRVGGERLPLRPRIVAGPAFPIRAAFYYPWFPQAWKQRGYDPYTQFNPTLGFYDSSSDAVIADHLEAMRYGGIDAGIVSWFGPGTTSDQRIPALLEGVRGGGFRWALYYEQEARGDPSPAAIERDLRYVSERYAHDPAYLRIDGQFVVFVYTDANDTEQMTRRWKQAADATGAYINLKVFSGYRDAPDQPDAWHQYAPSSAEDSQPGSAYEVSPGFWARDDAEPRLARSADQFAAAVQRMVASKEPWQLITTFNEWGEGTAVESAAEWATASGFGQYLDLLHENGN